jgi:hypothetical protein
MGPLLLTRFWRSLQKVWTAIHIGQVEYKPIRMATTERRSLFPESLHSATKQFLVRLIIGRIGFRRFPCKGIGLRRLHASECVDRQLTDEQIKLLIERDAWMLYPGWVPGQTSNIVVSLKTVVDHIDHVCQLAGNARHSALGTDLDGGFGTEQSPRDLDLQKIPNLLSKRGTSGGRYRGNYAWQLVPIFQESLVKLTYLYLSSRAKDSMIHSEFSKIVNSSRSNMRSFPSESFRRAEKPCPRIRAIESVLPHSSPM